VPRLRKIAIAAALLIGLAAAQALAGQPDDVSKLFGARVQANSRFQAPFATGDFDGDGKPDALYLVTILPGSAENRLASDVTVIGSLFGQEALGERPESLALAIVQDGNKKKFLLTGYEGEGVADYFGSPIWEEPAVPIQIAKRGSKTFEDFQRQEGKIKNDIIVVGTEAGIDTALFWTGRSYALFQPAEEP
jgi:hypothetical protein